MLILSKNNRLRYNFDHDCCHMIVDLPRSLAEAVKRLLLLLSRQDYATVDGDGSDVGVYDGAEPMPDARLSTLRKELVEKAQLLSFFYFILYNFFYLLLKPF